MPPNPQTAHHVARRRHRLAAAVLGRPPQEDGAGGEIGVFTGRIVDITPHLIIIETPAGGEERLVIAPWATGWHGSDTAPADLPTGARAVIRTIPGGRVTDRIWAAIARVTGTIVTVGSSGRDFVAEIDRGPHRGTCSITIPYRSLGRIQVRFPQLKPGYLIDVIGILTDDGISARIPATSQPPYAAAVVPTPPQMLGGIASKIAGSATWSWEISEETARGAAYPMLEHEDSGCARRPATALPYLSLGSRLHIRNLCTDQAQAVQITECGCVAGTFLDRCLRCDTSPRGRVAELSPRSFVELGGDLASGCFNAEIGLG